MESLNEIILKYLEILEQNVLFLNTEICKFINLNILSKQEEISSIENGEISLIAFFVIGFFSFFIFSIFSNFLKSFGLKNDNFQYNKFENGRILDVIDSVMCFLFFRKINL